jgi:hypothetical protein
LSEPQKRLSPQRAVHAATPDFTALTNAEAREHLRLLLAVGFSEQHIASLFGLTVGDVRRAATRAADH